eukprot:maker-scaffold_54-snap-gene-1.20-mRNA-1 protein AED:0.24 eAED:0.24 QI:126/0.66/0.5/1/0.66/0.5/4/0/318
MPEKENQSENIEWLRNHGVSVTTPNSRKLEDELLAQVQDLSIETKQSNDTYSFKYALIPANITTPSEQKIVSIPKRFLSLKKDLLSILLAPHFASGSTDKHSLRKTLEQNTLAQNLPQNINLENIVEKNLGGGGSVESFRCGNDEVGAFKKLEKNIRASKLAQVCGFENISFFGDVFVGRYVLKGDRMLNVDFLSEELEGERMMSWAIKARDENMRTIGTGGEATEEIIHEKEGEGYSWRQDGEEVEVTFSKESFDKKQVQVKFKRREVNVVIGKEIFAFNPLFSEINVDECSWSIVDGKLVLTLIKVNEDLTWTTLF